MTFWAAAAVVASCVIHASSAKECIAQHLSALPTQENGRSAVAGAQSSSTSSLAPTFSGSAVDVVLTAQAAFAWDEQTDTILYEKNADTRRPVASLSKLLSALAIREMLPTSREVAVPPAVKTVQRRGAHVRLPVGEHASVYDLLSASLIASANDAMTSLAVAVGQSEEEFTNLANAFAARRGFINTKISNATGLEGDGEAYSTARDIKGIFQLAYRDTTLRTLLVSESGTLRTREGTVRRYRSTNKLLGTYFPVLAAKTGYTPAAGENLVVMTYGENGQRIGAVVLGSEARFQDMKTLVEWMLRNYTWP